jgi:hypothetical protein
MYERGGSETQGGVSACGDQALVLGLGNPLKRSLVIDACFQRIPCYDP